MYQCIPTRAQCHKNVKKLKKIVDALTALFGPKTSSNLVRSRLVALFTMAITRTVISTIITILVAVLRTVGTIFTGVIAANG